ncbi:MAG TPA: hypothetical protein VH165_28920, partial [Kofleriaceae bacterium]|nr:hypothetical protein [Kofleriaceae bacterium]
ALRSWLDPRELVRLGSAMRNRTSHLFEGMFEPQALPPPAAGAEPPRAPAPVAPAEPVVPAAAPGPTADPKGRS